MRIRDHASQLPVLRWYCAICILCRIESAFGQWLVLAFLISNANISVLHYVITLAEVLARHFDNPRNNTGTQNRHLSIMSAQSKRASDRSQRAPEDADTRLSKAMSYVLRHGAAAEGVPVTRDGWITLPDLLAYLARKRHPVALADVQRIVSRDTKQRYLLTPPAATGGPWRIRANQGHSIAVEVVMTPITAAIPGVAVVHSTFRRHLDAIKREGLSRMSRQHVHFAKLERHHLEKPLRGSDALRRAGARVNAEVLVVLDVERALADGLVLLQSANNVVLSPGLNGVVPAKYFERIIHI